jgi:hypothetical protein
MESPDSSVTITQAFLEALERLPRRYSEGTYKGRSYGATVSSAAMGHEIKLYAEELGGKDHVSFNLYTLSDGTRTLKPCEMPAEKVVDFVLGYQPYL